MRLLNTQQKIEILKRGIENLEEGREISDGLYYKNSKGNIVKSRLFESLDERRYINMPKVVESKIKMAEDDLKKYDEERNNKALRLSIILGISELLSANTSTLSYEWRCDGVLMKLRQGSPGHSARSFVCNYSTSASYSGSQLKDFYRIIKEELLLVIKYEKERL